MKLAPLAIALFLCGCTTVPTSRDYSGDFIIHTAEVHPARTGMTLRTLEKNLGPDYVLHSENDFTIVCTREGEELYRLKTRPRRSDHVISEIIITNPKFRTEAGLSPGDSLEEAIRIYGPVMFFHQPGGTPERVVFRGLTGSQLYLMLRSPDQHTIGNYAGVRPYPDGTLRTERPRRDIIVESITLREPRR